MLTFYFLQQRTALVKVEYKKQQAEQVKFHTFNYLPTIKIHG